MTNRRGNRPARPQRPFKKVPIITEQYRGKVLTDAKVKLSLMQRLKMWGGRLRRLFGRKKRHIETKTIKSKWISEKRSQWTIDRGIRKATIKARNRRNRKQARTLHQMERRSA